jgi:hypothetical protein
MEQAAALWNRPKSYFGTSANGRCIGRVMTWPYQAVDGVPPFGATLVPIHDCSRQLDLRI